MKNILKSKVGIIAILFTLAFLSYTTYVGVGEKKRYNETLDYLTVQKGYEENDIKSINVEYSFLNVLLSYEEWTISVVFADEPNAIYSYHYKNGVINQGGLSGSTEDDNYNHVEGAEGGLNKGNKY